MNKKGVVFTLIVFIYTIYILLLANVIFNERTSLEFLEQKRTSEAVAFDTYKNVLLNLSKIAEKDLGLVVKYDYNWVYIKQKIPYYEKAVVFGNHIHSYESMYPIVHYFPTNIQGYFDRFIFTGESDVNYIFLYGNYKGIGFEFNDLNAIVMHLYFDYDVNSIDKSCGDFDSGSVDIDFYFEDENNVLRLNCNDVNLNNTIKVYLTDDQNYAAKLVLGNNFLRVFSENDFNVLVDANLYINRQLKYKTIDVNFYYKNDEMKVYLEK